MKVRSTRRLCSFGCLVLFGIASVVWFFHPVVAGHPKSNFWMTDMRAAQRIAQQKQLPMLLHFYGETCPPCLRMEAEILNRPELHRQLNGHLVPVKLNASQHVQFLDRVGISGVPADVFLSPDGKVISQSQGYQSPREYLARVARIDLDWSRLKQIQFAKNRHKSPPIRSGPRRQQSSAKKQKSVPANEMKKHAPKSIARSEVGANKKANWDDADVPQPILGMSGFSPVALFEKHIWKRGRREFAGVYKGIVYYMRDDVELARFNSNPENYAPQLFGCDPVVLRDSDRAIVGETEFGAYFQKRLYLFVSRESRKQFSSNPEHYVELQNVLHLHDIDASSRQ